MQSPARVSDRTTPHLLREVATIAECPEELVAAASLCRDHRRLLAIVQRQVNNVRGKHSSVFETHAGDIAPVKRLIPFSVEVREHANPHARIIELHDQEVAKRLPGA